jgi:hypothetical protein
LPLLPCSHSTNLLSERQNIRQGPKGRDAERVDLSVALGVMPLDVLKLRRFPKSLLVPVEVTHPLVEEGVAGSDIADVALEVLDIDGLSSA